MIIILLILKVLLFSFEFTYSDYDGAQMFCSAIPSGLWSEGNAPLYLSWRRRVSTKGQREGREWDLCVNLWLTLLLTFLLPFLSFILSPSLLTAPFHLFYHHLSSHAPPSSPHSPPHPISLPPSLFFSLLFLLPFPYRISYSTTPPLVILLSSQS